MRYPMTTRERVLVTLTVCMALVAAPLTALAATGQLVNIVDGSNAANVARVNGTGALAVQTQPGLLTTWATKVATRGSLGWRNLLTYASAGRRIAVLEASFAAAGPAGGMFTAALRMYSIGPAPDATCSDPTAGSNKVILTRTVVVTNGSTVQLDFGANGMPSIEPVGAGSQHCLGFLITQAPASSTLAVGTSYYSVAG